MKWLIVLVIAVIIVGGIGIYVVNVATSDIVLEEESPLNRIDSGNLVIKDELDNMDDETMKEFEDQTELMKDKVMEMDDKMQGSVKLLSTGDFKARAHSVKGKALLIEDEGETIVRFEDFDTINGPALYIYLSSDLGDDDFIDLGPIKATKGDVNYVIPEGVDTDKYNKVLVWCRPFSVLFSYAELE